MKKINTFSRIINRKSLLAVLLIILLSAGTIYFLNKGPDQITDSLPVNPQEDTSSYVNLDPPTEQELKATENKKEEIINSEGQTNETQNSGLKSVTPVISYAEQYENQIEVAGTVPGVIEDGGTCTAKFTKDGIMFEKSVSSVKNVNDTSCPQIAIPTGDFQSKGEWKVTMIYKSSSSSGASDARSFEVR